MLSNKAFRLLAVLLLSITIPSIARAQKPVGEIMCACPGVSKPLGNAANCEEACYGRRSSPGGGASSDTRARDEARAREESEARAREEAEAAERERIAEAKRKKEEEADAKFIRDRDAAANTLKGSTGTTNPDHFGLKGSSDFGLRDAVAEPGLKGSTRSKPDPSKQAAAWRQLHCAASIFGYALSALQTKGDYDEYGTLSVEAMKALEGKRLTVECKSAPSVPSVGGTEVDVDKLKAAEKTLIDRANTLAQRMKQTPAALSQPQTPKPPAPQPAVQPCTGTRIERMRCAQARLNDINTKKVTGNTKEEISTEEKNRRELAELVLKNNGLEKGELTSFNEDVSEKAAPTTPGTTKPSGRRPVPPPKP